MSKTGLFWKKYTVLLGVTAAGAVLVSAVVPRFAIASVPVEQVSVVHAGSAEATVSCTGSITAAKESDVYYSVPLKAEKVHVHIGDTVRAGQALVDVDTADTLETFEATRTAAALQTQNASSQSTGTAETDGVAGSAGLSGVSSVNGTNAAQLAAAYQAAASQGTAAQAGSSNIQTENDTGTPEIPSVVRAPISGIVTALSVTDGDFSSPGAPVVTVTDMGNLEVKAQVDEILISSVKVGQKATITGDGFKTAYTGRISRIYPSARTVVSDSGTQTVVDVLVSIDKPGADLKPGLTANVDIVTVQSSRTLQIPYESICEDDRNREYVYVLRQGRARRATIETGSEYTNSIEVTSGLREGDIILVSPPDTLADGELVRTEAESKTGASSSQGGAA